MALSDFVTSAIEKIRNGDILNNRPNSEALMALMSANINFLIDKGFYDEDFTMNGYFNANDFDNGVGGIKQVRFDSEVLEYQFSMRNNGSSGNNIFNVEIRDDDGSLIGNLFGSGGDRLLMPANNRTNVLIGKDVKNGNIPIAANIGTATPQYGGLNYTTLQKGWLLIPFIEANGVKALHANFKLRLRGI